MNRSEKARVTIEIYDEDGDLRESLGGEYTFRQIRSMMKEILENDGIPVIRQLGKHAKVEEKLPELADLAKKMLKDFKHEDEMKVLKIPKPEVIPMVLEYEFDGIKFHAAGHPLDVHAANNALLKRVFEE